MGKFIYIFLVLFFSLLLQVFTGNIGVVLPVVALSVFYLTIIFDWQTGLLSGVFSGVVLDLIYGRSLFISPLINIAVSIFAILWLHKGELKVLAFQMIPASILSLFYILPFTTYHQTEHGFIIAVSKLAVIILSTLFSALLFPCIITFLDLINRPLGFNSYKTSEERISKS